MCRRWSGPTCREVAAIALPDGCLALRSEVPSVNETFATETQKARGWHRSCASQKQSGDSRHKARARKSVRATAMGFRRRTRRTPHACRAYACAHVRTVSWAFEGGLENNAGASTAARTRRAAAAFREVCRRLRRHRPRQHRASWRERPTGSRGFVRPSGRLSSASANVPASIARRRLSTSTSFRALPKLATTCLPSRKRATTTFAASGGASPGARSRTSSADSSRLASMRGRSLTSSMMFEGSYPP